ncbi:hypothetical protein DSL72_009260 [Monilinia vaccinii-corymbosi]|uniref:C2H2-type domain-containing protein n=1 Tax=Monilinia vaccinii-corymbosi TaxID=61207 RepID=A0A8A3PQU6_9HELO|nr:hypothetical protein DSL72_009260 [Monilinia vaccinii-corymbosi]
MASEEVKGIVHDTKVHCKICQVTFTEWTDYHNHKMTSREHICCDICSNDFHTDEGLKRHRTLLHPKEQDLSCLGCGKKYIRLGSLIAHLELDSCHAINSEARENLAARRRQRQQLHEKFKASLKNIDDNAGISVLGSRAIPTNATHPIPNNLAYPDVPPPPTFEGKLTHTVEFGGWETTILEEDDPSRESQELISNIQPQSVMELQPGEDLISFTDVVKGMSQPWGIPSKKIAKETPKPAEEVKYECFDDSFPIAIAPSMKESNFPPLPSANNFKDAGMKAPNFMDTPLDDSKFSSIWDTKHIIANAQTPIPPPPTAASPVTDVAARAGGLPPLRMRPLVNPLPEKEYAPYDPNDPKFRAQRYWVPFTQKFKCPHRLCKKSFNTESGLTQHLLSAAHAGNNRLICPNCYRSFGTYTALTQHCESQGVRCKIREADNYGRVVDDITASVADVIGRHDDETVRYTVNKEGWGDIEAISHMARRHNEAEEKKSRNRANYWKEHDEDFEW